MNQINFNEDIRKTKISKLKKAQILPKVKFTQPTQKKQYYLMIHNKIKINYRNRQYKNVYQKLTNLEKPQPAYLFSYFQDLAYSSIKMLRQFIIHKQVNANTASDIQMYTHKCKDTIYKLYKLFTFDEQVINDRKSVNLQRQHQITRFLNIIVSFTLQHALICFIQNKSHKSKQAYEFLYSICSNILTSTTSNYKILRKVGQGLIVYSVYLIEINQISQAIQVLFDCLKNEMNLLIILSYRLKEKSRSQSKRRKLQIYNRLYAIFFNLTNCFYISRQLHWCYLCLRECQIISELKVKLLEKDIKINWEEILKNYQVLYDQYKQIRTIAETYFNQKQLREQLILIKRQDARHNNFEEQAYKQMMSVNSYPKSNKIELKKNHKKNTIRRSVSLQQNLNIEKNKKFYKDFGQELLFYGLNLFQNKQNRPKSQKISFKQNLHQSKVNICKDAFKRELNSKINQNSSKLKKKPKKVENTLFRKIQQPIQYNQLQNKFQKMWIEQQRINNGCKQKKYLLKYKSQYINYKQIAQENTNIYQEIQVIKKKDDYVFKEKKKVNEAQEEEKEKGIQLFKKIILKHSKKIDIKKTQTFNVLKKKRTSQSVFESYSEPIQSKVKKQQQRVQNNKNKIKQAQMERIERQRYKGIASNVFLTKDTVQIPNLFLSYIASSGFSCQAPTSLLQFSQKPSKFEQI